MLPAAGLRNAAARSVACGTRCVTRAILSSALSQKSSSIQVFGGIYNARALPLGASKYASINKQPGLQSRLAARALTTLADVQPGMCANGEGPTITMLLLPAWRTFCAHVFSFALQVPLTTQRNLLPHAAHQ